MGEAFDFLGPFMRAAIIVDPTNRAMTRYPLWTFDRIDAQSPGPLRSREIELMGSLAFLSEITVKLGLAHIPTITAVLTPPFEAARLFLDSPLIEWSRSAIEVQFGYSSPSGTVASPVFEALILKPEITLGADVSITLNGAGVGGLSAERASSGTPQANVSLRDVFDTLCKKHNMVLDDSALGDKQGFSWIEKRESVVTGHIADWAFIVQEARNIGCWVYLESSDVGADRKSKLRILSIDGVSDGTPEYTFRLFDFENGTIGPKNGQFPILGISTPTSAIYLSSATQKLRLLGTDSKTREPVKVEITDKTHPAKRTDKGQTGPTTTNDESEEGSFLAVDAGSPEAATLAKNEYKAAVNNMGIRVEVQTLGIPNLRPGQIVQLAGVGTRLGGKFAVFEVTHTLGSSGFATSFVAYSNVSQLFLKMGESNPAQSANDKQRNEALPDAVMDRTNKLPIFADSTQGVA